MGFVNGKLVRRRHRCHPGPPGEAPEPRPEPRQMISSAKRCRDLAVGRKVGLDVLPHRERHIGVPGSLAERFPVGLGVPARCGVAVPHAVEVDEEQAGVLGQSLEPTCDHVRMRGPTVLPAEEETMILIIVAEVGALGVELVHQDRRDGDRLHSGSPVRAGGLIFQGGLQ